MDSFEREDEENSGDGFVDRFGRHRSPGQRRSPENPRNFSPERHQKRETHSSYRPRRRSLSPDEDRWSKRRRSFSTHPEPHRSSYPANDHHNGDHRDRRDPGFRNSRPDRHSLPFPLPEGLAGFDGFPMDMGVLPPIDPAFAGGMAGAWNGQGDPLANGGPPDPSKLDYLLSFPQFCEYLESTDGYRRSDEELSKRYTIMKENYFARQAQVFFDVHQTEPWLREKYHPEDHQSIRLDTLERRRKLLSSFLPSLDNGEFDAVCFDEPTSVEKVEVKSKTEAKDPTQSENEGIAPEPETENVEQNTIKWIDDSILKRTIFIKTIPPSLARKQVEEMCKTVLGERFQYLSLSDPNPSKKFYRQGWIVCQDGAEISKAFADIDGQAVDNFKFHFALPSERRDPLRPRLAPEATGSADRLRHDFERALQLTESLEMELGDKTGSEKVLARAATFVENSIVVDEESSESVDVEKIKQTKQKLDLLLLYLRQVHMTCYYCALECDSSEELARKCCVHYRKKLGGDQTPKERNWLKHFDSKIDYIISGDAMPVEKFGGRDVAIETDRFVEKNVGFVEDQKYRCVLCSKLFKGEDFVKKHIYAKHADAVGEFETKLTFFNNFARDPHHLSPFQATSSNHSGNNPPMMQAMSRMPPPAPGLFPPMAMLPPVFPPFPIASAAAGTPLDQIPRLGFNRSPDASRSSIGYSRRHSVNELKRKRSDSEHRNDGARPPPPEGAVVDPRSVRSYEDLDAPAAGGDIDSEINFF